MINHGYASINPEENVPTPGHESATFGFWTGFFFMINCTVGAGFLSLPWAYSEAGWLFCLCIQLGTTALCAYLFRLYLEVMSYTEAVIQMREGGIEIEPVTLKGFFALLKYKQEPLANPSVIAPVITERRLDASKIVKVLLGDRFGYVYLAVLYIYFIGTETAYAAIFATIFAANVPLGFSDDCQVDKYSGVYNSCKPNYWFFLMIFAAMTIYLTLKGFKEQQWFQALMSMMRFLVIALVLITCIIAIATHSNLTDDDYNHIGMPKLIEPKLIGRAIPAIVFANLFIIQVPSIAVQIKDKPRLLPRIGYSVVLTVCLMFSALGLVVPVAAGHMSSLSTLVYEGYSAGYSASERPVWTYMIEYFILLFPALDVVSSFPLCSCVIADNIANVIYNSSENQLKWKTLLKIKLAASVPPLILAFFESDLGVIIDWTGLFGFFLMIFMVFVLHITGQGLVPQETAYSTPSHPLCSFFLALATIPIVVAVVALNLLYPET